MADRKLPRPEPRRIGYSNHLEAASGDDGAGEKENAASVQGWIMRPQNEKFGGAPHHGWVILLLVVAIITIVAVGFR